MQLKKITIGTYINYALDSKIYDLFLQDDIKENFNDVLSKLKRCSIYMNHILQRILDNKGVQSCGYRCPGLTYQRFFIVFLNIQFECLRFDNMPLKFIYEYLTNSIQKFKVGSTFNKFCYCARFIYQFISFYHRYLWFVYH